MRLLVLGILLAFLLASCGGDERVVIIGPNQVPCSAQSQSSCFLVKDDRGDPWTVVNATIEQLEYEDSYSYTVLVRERDRIEGDAVTPPKVTFYVVDVLEKEEVLGRIKWYYG